jgi:hypothetical protein
MTETYRGKRPNGYPLATSSAVSPRCRECSREKCTPAIPCIHLNALRRGRMVLRQGVQAGKRRRRFAPCTPHSAKVSSWPARAWEGGGHCKTVYAASSPRHAHCHNARSRELAGQRVGRAMQVHDQTLPQRAMGCTNPAGARETR